MKSFDKWVDELREQVNKPKMDLPYDVVEGNSDGEFLFRCRGCNSWKPIEWDLDEDHYDAHYCGGSPQCCPTVAPTAPNPAPVGTPLGGKPMPAQKPKRAPMPSAPPPAPVAHITCPACKMRIPPHNSPQHQITGQLYCGRKICDDYIYHNSLLSPNVKCFSCPGCGMTTPQSQARVDKVSGLPFCGAHSCQAYLQRVARAQPIPPPPPRAG
jgi:hypothetical protein